MPLNEVRVVVGLVLATVVLALLPPRRPVAGKLWQRAALLVGLPLLAAVTVLVVSESEPARKAASAHAGFTGALVALGQRSFDFDHDGYSRFSAAATATTATPGATPARRIGPTTASIRTATARTPPSSRCARRPCIPYPPRSRLTSSFFS